jgi:hypothetical protein
VRGGDISVFLGQLLNDVDRWWLRPLYTHYNYAGRKRA